MNEQLNQTWLLSEGSLHTLSLPAKITRMLAFIFLDSSCSLKKEALIWPTSRERLLPKVFPRSGKTQHLKTVLSVKYIFPVAFMMEVWIRCANHEKLQTKSNQERKLGNTWKILLFSNFDPVKVYELCVE